ncbi:hypothetical protein KAR91_27660 [Candidatus Pacearchaeota archaeon]|nr:hypothetical protein [Candidatus Pacearchaeota archaeon]
MNENTDYIKVTIKRTVEIGGKRHTTIKSVDMSLPKMSDGLSFLQEILEQFEEKITID